MKVRKLPVEPGVTGWNAILGPQTAYPSLDQSKTCDNLIIGAGFAGLAVAQRLHQLSPKDKTLLVEAGKIAHGPAGRNSGFMLDLPHDLSAGNYSGDKPHCADEHLNEIKFNRAGIDFAAAMAKEYAMAPEAFSACGKVNAAANAKGMQHNKEYATHLQSLNEPHSFLDAEQMQALTGSAYYRGGLYTPRAAMIQPAMFVRKLARGISQHTPIFENSAIISLARQGDSWQANTKNAAISAKNVFLTVNGHLESFGFYARRLLHVFTYASMTRALTPDEIITLGGEPQWACVPAHPMGSTLRRISGTGGERIIIRNRFTYDPSMQVSEKRIEKVARAHRKSFDRRFPALKQVEMQYRWGGRLCLSKNNVYAFGELEPGLFSACCQNGLGTAKGTASGKLVAEMACGHQSDLLKNVLQQDKPVKLPPEPLTWIGANAVMRWGEFRAGTEF